MPCGACGPTFNQAEIDMYKALEKRVREVEAKEKQEERERRLALGLPAEEGEVYFSSIPWRRGAKISYAAQVP